MTIPTACLSRCHLQTKTFLVLLLVLLFLLILLLLFSAVAVFCCCLFLLLLVHKHLCIQKPDWLLDQGSAAGDADLTANVEHAATKLHAYSFRLQHYM